MAPRWRLKATTIEGGFTLRLIGDGDLGEALDDAEAVAVEMEDGRTLSLEEAILQLIEGRVTEFIVLMTDRFGVKLPVDGCHGQELLH